MGAVLQRSLAEYYGYDQKRCYNCHNERRCILIENGILHDYWEPYKILGNAKIRFDGTISCIDKYTTSDDNGLEVFHYKQSIFKPMDHFLITKVYHYRNTRLPRLVLPGNRILDSDIIEENHKCWNYKN